MGIPAPTLQFLASGGTDALWDLIRRRLERNGLSPQGRVILQLTPEAADVLSGVLGQQFSSRRTSVNLGELDAALRQSAAGAGLVEVTAAVTGSMLIDRKRVTTARVAASADLAAALDAAVNGVGLTANQTQRFLADVRSSGILTKAGTGSALRAIAGFTTGWRELVRGQALDDSDAGLAPSWGLGELASFSTGTAHGLDDGRLAASLMLRAFSVAFDTPMPRTGEERRRLWQRAGIAADDVSGTALTWGFCPPGEDRWSTMIRERTGLGVVSHLTVQELRTAGAVSITQPGVTVFACENPQILSAAARAGVAAPMLCLSGQGSAAGWEVLRWLIRDGATVRYHGDFDWPGIRIATRVITAGALPWRMGAGDYSAAVSEVSEQVPLEGHPAATPWDPALESVMKASNVILHEEAVVATLIGDMHLQVRQHASPNVGRSAGEPGLSMLP